MRATPRSVEKHSTPAMASRGISSLPPAGWHSAAPRRIPSKRYRSPAVKSARDPGLAGTGNALGQAVNEIVGQVDGTLLGKLGEQRAADIKRRQRQRQHQAGAQPAGQQKQR